MRPIIRFLLSLTLTLTLAAAMAVATAAPLIANASEEAGSEEAVSEESHAEEAFEHCEDGEDGTSSLGQPVKLEGVQHGSLLFRTSQPGAFLPAPSLETDVSLEVTGLIARARVRQRFHNPTDQWLEGVYVFPLPEDAAVDGLKLVVGERVIEGEIRKREEAKKVYEQAKSEGKKASLIEQERPNIFTNSVANIGPDEEIDVVIEYQQTLRYDGGRFSLRFPMVVAPRYVPSHPVPTRRRRPDTESRTASSSGGGGGVVTAQLSNPTPSTEFSSQGWALDTARITPPVAVPGKKPLNPVFLHIELDAGLPLAELDSPSHALHVEPGQGTSTLVELADVVVEADRDFVLEWEPEVASVPQAALFTQELEGELYTLLMVLPPHADGGVARLPRETIFVIDTSGSMGGASIRQARQALLMALDQLRPEDHFNVIQFNNRSHRLFTESAPATHGNLETAKSYVDGLRADGGTNMLDALQSALSRQEQDRGLRQVIFVTDGSVGNEQQLFGFIHNNLLDSRLFTVGIGSAPNSHFMTRAAEHGRGTFTYIGDLSEVQQRMGDLFEKLESPVLHDVEVVWNDPVAETWPERIGDLYKGEPIVVAAKLPNGTSGSGSEIRVAGWRGTEPWEQSFQLAGGAQENGIDKLWARRKIAAVMRSLAAGAEGDEVRQRVAELGLHHHLVTRYTSLVAVDVTPTAPAEVEPQSRPLPVSLPAGWQAQHANVNLPNGATPARLDLALGMFALLLACALARLGRRRSA